MNFSGVKLFLVKSLPPYGGSGLKLFLAGQDKCFPQVSLHTEGVD